MRPNDNFNSIGSPPLNVKSTVLLVEDDNYVSAAIWTLLKYANFEVTIAASGAEGLKLARSLTPDIVVLDVDLPEMNGLEICRHLKADPGTASLPVIFFSGQSHAAQQALDLGAEAFLFKPKDIGQIPDRLRKILDSRAIAQMPQNPADAVAV